MSIVEAPVPPASPLAELHTVADLVQQLGGIPLERIRLHPLPGTATEEDVIRADGCELVDGVLVEKAMGYYESRLALVLGYFIEAYLESHDLGFALEGEAMTRVAPRQVRRPDLSCFFWERFPNRLLPLGQILKMTPDFAVEVISPGNTVAELDRKRREYFQGGARLVWQVSPERRTVRVYTSVTDFTELGDNDTLDGGDVLPGFSLSIRRWFERAGQRAES
jgi:Uma2 family endonuclease